MRNKFLIYKMENLYSDLEEGEILDDDSPPSPVPSLNKRKELPRRYIVRDNKTPLHRHKKGCRHAIRHHAKKLSKLKKTPPKKKNSPKWYDKSTHTYEKYKVIDSYTCSKTSRHILPKKACFSQNSLIAEMKGSLKNVSPPKKLSTNLNRIKSQETSSLKQSFKISENDFVTSEMSSAKELKNDVDNSMVNSMSTNYDYLTERTDSNQSLLDLSKNSDDALSVIELSTPTKPTPPLIDLSRSPDDMSNTIELNSDNDAKNTDNAVSNSVLVKDEESEDEEELRRIALATCAKRKILCESVNTIQNTDFATSVPVPDLTYVNVQISHQKTNNSTSDNYEVVDMDVDEDMQDPLETAQTPLISQFVSSSENLFVIDTNPSCDLLEKKNSISEKHTRINIDNEDLEVNILRAELINSMYRKKLSQEDTKQTSNIAIHEKQMPVMHQRRPMVNYPKPNLLFCHKRLKSAKHFLRKRSVNKLINNSKKIINNKTPSLPVQVNKPSERLIITVNGESSDDSDEETDTVPENPVDSIVALISDCRQKSDSIVETKEKENIPKALSCLSKAQQEEYNSLMKILAKKKKLPTADKTVSVKNGSVHSPLDDLKKLDEKLVALKGALKNKKESMALLTKEVNSKKLQYMKAKLTTQHLKEQLVAAEKVRKAKLLEWSKTCDSLKLMKQSLLDLENKVNEVQNLRSKVSSSLQGQSYKLPQLSSGNKQS